ncbi:MAG TPA: glycosyl hydrolase family 28-related protein, partial [Panacibacter sp.]|nr:glycosyl hydrolase family 28-related protein [Panacibacter sp.]
MKYPKRYLAIGLSLFFLQMQCYAGIINVKNFGAKGNGVADDTKAIQDAINAAPVATMSTIYFPAGVYRIASYTVTRNYLENYCLLLHANLTVKGDGEKTIIRLADHIFDKPDTPANAHIFYGLKINNIHFTDLTIDMNGGKNLVPEHYIKNHTAIFVYLGRNISLNKLTVKNCAGCNMVVIKGNGNLALIEDCKFYNGGNYVGTDQPNSRQFDFSFVYSEWDSTTIKNNIIEQQNLDIALSNYTGGIEMHGSYSHASYNSITGCYPAFFVSSSWHPMEKTSVENNQIKNCIKGVSFWVIHPMNNIVIRNNNIQLTYTRLLKPPLLPGIEVPGGNMVNNDDYKPALANAAPVSNITITGNNITAVLPDTTKDRTVGLL